ncbi:MAG: hypothetical protein Q8P50_17315, partial [Bacillota bacterium]|nr:hypothetical protein [Bacillota bacterium]
GVGRLRQHLVREGMPASGEAARARHFVLTCSVVVATGAVNREFDGAIVRIRISPKDGAITLHLLETKSGRDADRIEMLLKEKANVLNFIAPQIQRLDRNTSYMTLTFPAVAGVHQP